MVTPADPTPPDTQAAYDLGIHGDAVHTVQTAINTLSEVLLGYNPDDWRDALRLLHRLRGTIEDLRKIDALLTSWLYLHGEHGMHLTLDGIPGEFSIGRGRSKERWAAMEAVTSYVEQKIAAHDGEMPDYDTVLAWVAEVVPLGASTSLRKTPLRAVGLDVEDYLTSEPGTVRVDLPRRT